MAHLKTISCLTAAVHAADSHEKSESSSLDFDRLSIVGNQIGQYPDTKLDVGSKDSILLQRKQTDAFSIPNIMIRLPKTLV